MYGQRYPSDVDKIKVSFSQYLDGFYSACDGVSHRNYQGKVIKGDIDGLLDSDVMTYYQLENKYDSPLKRKMFKESEEYQTLLEHLETERTFLLADTFYIVSDIHKTDYDLRKKAFYFHQYTDAIGYSSTYYVDFRYLGIVSPLITFTSVKVAIEDERTALEVENNYQDCRLVYIFTFDEELSRKNETVPIGKLQKLLLVNIKSGKVYFFRAKKSNLVQYDHDIYAELKKEGGIDYPVKYFLKVGNKMHELAFDELWDDYKLEMDGDKYFVVGVDSKRYLLHFKPKLVICYEKDSIYDAKCEEIAKDYKRHPENYQDVTMDPDGGPHYIDKSGNDWVCESESIGYHVLEDEGVYWIVDEMKFIRRKIQR